MPIANDPTVEVQRTFHMPGYVLDAGILRRIDTVCKESIAKTEETSDDKLKFECWEKTDEGQVARFDKIDSLIEHLDTGAFNPDRITLQYTLPDRAGIHLTFQQKGHAELVAYSKSLDFRFYVEELDREIRRSDQEYTWAVKALIFRPYASRAVKSLLLPLSIVLLASTAYYIYARQVGVNINPSVIPRGNAYYKQVEEAIRSPDLSTKIDVLLAGQLQGFINVDDVLRRQESLIVLCLIAIGLAGSFLLIRRWVVRLYPLSFFAFDTQKPRLAKLQRKREILGVAVILGFIVNLVAGLLIAFLTN